MHTALFYANFQWLLPWLSFSAANPQFRGLVGQREPSQLVHIPPPRIRVKPNLENPDPETANRPKSLANGWHVQGPCRKLPQPHRCAGTTKTGLQQLPAALPKLDLGALIIRIGFWGDAGESLSTCRSRSIASYFWDQESKVCTGKSFGLGHLRVRLRGSVE